MSEPSEPNVVAFLRDKGAICYALRLFRDSRGRLLPQRFDEMLGSGLDWYWTSDRTERVSEESALKNLPSPRCLTRLLATTSGDLLNDFEESDVDGYGRHIVMLGLEAGSTERALLGPQFRTSLMHFANEESSPIRIVLYQENDSFENQVFVWRKLSTEIRGILECWDIRPDVIDWWHRRKYSRLGIVRLENLVEGATRMAAGQIWGLRSTSTP